MSSIEEGHVAFHRLAELQMHRREKLDRDLSVLAEQIAWVNPDVDVSLCWDVEGAVDAVELHLVCLTHGV